MKKCQPSWTLISWQILWSKWPKPCRMKQDGRDRHCHMSGLDLVLWSISRWTPIVHHHLGETDGQNLTSLGVLPGYCCGPSHWPGKIPGHPSSRNWRNYSAYAGEVRSGGLYGGVNTRKQSGQMCSSFQGEIKGLIHVMNSIWEEHSDWFQPKTSVFLPALSINGIIKWECKYRSPVLLFLTK